MPKRQLDWAISSLASSPTGKVQRPERKLVDRKRGRSAGGLWRSPKIVIWSHLAGNRKRSKDGVGQIKRSYMKMLEDTVAEALVVPEEMRGKIPCGNVLTFYGMAA